MEHYWCTGCEEYFDTPIGHTPYYVFVCLGTEPIFFGPYVTESSAKDRLNLHMDGLDRCSNGLETLDHHVSLLRFS